MLYVKESGVNGTCKQCGRKKSEVKLYRITKRENNKKTIFLCKECISDTLAQIIDILEKNHDAWLSDILGKEDLN